VRSLFGDLANEVETVRIVIFAGGTGSIALQRGLYNALDAHLDGVDTKVIVNAYDNGLSTGTVRRVMGGQILGPSDVRKNQTTRLQLQNPDSPWLRFLNRRFSVHVSNALNVCEENVAQLLNSLDTHDLDIDISAILFRAVAEYFKSPLAMKVDYDDFSLANIIYAGLARTQGNSLRASARIIAEAICIPDNVLLNDDKSLYLGAITETGKRVTDEGDIVCWGNEADPFVDIFFTDVNGNTCQPELCDEARQAIRNADLIILSSGTQWSSLIPTYASNGFRTAIDESNAKLLMIMNRTPDRDSPSQSASDIINILMPRYFDVGRLHVITDETGHPKMRSLDHTALAKVASLTQAELSGADEPPDKHSPGKLTEAISRVYFGHHLKSNFYLFDYDDTLVGRDNKHPKSSIYNVNGISRLNGIAKIGVCTGNTIKSIKLRSDPAAISGALEPLYKPLLVFADGGVNRYSYDTHPVENDDDVHPELVACIWPDALLPTTGFHSVGAILANLKRAGIPPCKLENRGNALIAIKPVAQEDRHAVIAQIQTVIADSGLQVRKCGRTTVEICRPTLSKSCAVKYLRASLPQPLVITYVGDELDKGNDRDIKNFASEDTAVRCLHVESPAETAFFISTLIAYLTTNARR
jgi:2-phospho-L-lactate transferase/gluconeogenesis factor (CofD/UPF0052 family)